MAIDSFAAKLDLTLKALSMSRGRLAADLAVHKSGVARWLNGQALPSDYNLERLTALVAVRRPDFSMLDWDRDLTGFAEALGAATAPRANQRPDGLRLPSALMEQILASSELRADAYECFFRTTRPLGMMPGHFLHDHGMVRRDASGLLSLRMGIAGTELDGWLLPLHQHVFVVCSQPLTGALVFGMFNGVLQRRVEVMDGITLSQAPDAGRTITAAPVILHRIGPLSGDVAADEARYQELINLPALAPEGSVPEDIRDHLLRDFGPGAAALGGDLLMTMALARSMSRGPITPD
ncbi:hypothetical protein [Caulobacter sp. NIBR1757]|uniref:hypothetical protein n=1 Tax=Caulobacter sp. NIBR1757 TaxID=3016000 RepID=UPI0022EFDAD4|nr:hypothetical protein [Caulobacter sp. NIBR1757]WGM38431.1 hypothetical protein AMEJIAPC_01334 [Caulobacter sp. NIBR1757]